MHPWGIASALSLPLEESNMNPFSFCKGREFASVHQQLHCDYPGNTWQPGNEEQLLQSTPSRQGACKDSGLRQWHDISASLTSNFTEQQPFDNQERTPVENESARHDIKKDTRVWVWVRYESTFCGPWMNRANYMLGCSSAPFGFIPTRVPALLSPNFSLLPLESMEQPPVMLHWFPVSMWTYPLRQWPSTVQLYSTMVISAYRAILTYDSSPSTQVVFSQYPQPPIFVWLYN